MAWHKIRFSQIWYKVKKPNEMELFRNHFKNELINHQKYNESKFNKFCEFFLHDRKKFNSENDLKSYCQKMFNLYLEDI